MVIVIENGCFMHITVDYRTITAECMCCTIPHAHHWRGGKTYLSSTYGLGTYTYGGVLANEKELFI